jgi:DNA-directed RNA polymerase II subunit RPB9
MASMVRFCDECNNLLYPKEDVETRTLLYQCKLCGHTKPADDPVIHRSVLLKPGENEVVVMGDVTSDPTLPRTHRIRCPQCGNADVVYFQAGMGRRHDEHGMALFFVCNSRACNHRWKEADLVAAAPAASS